VCRECGESKPLDRFEKGRRKCRECRWTRLNANRRARNSERVAKQREYREENPHLYREQNLRHRYGITTAQYEALLAHQGGVCAGCGVSECPSGKALSVDHDHECCPPGANTIAERGCGRCVRGLLCTVCNTSDVLAGQPYVDWNQIK
jgi:hypothetical protein